MCPSCSALTGFRPRKLGGGGGTDPRLRFITECSTGSDQVLLLSSIKVLFARKVSGAMGGCSAQSLQLRIPFALDAEIALSRFTPVTWDLETALRQNEDSVWRS